MRTPDFSIIIPVRQKTAYLKETLQKLQKQTYKSFEVLVIDDAISSKYSNSNHHFGPAFKRNLGAKLSKGKYLAFLDDDSYPDKNWLKNAKKLLENTHISAVCGPCLTPKTDTEAQKASGLVWSSLIGSGGAGTYRNSPKKTRYVDDYPTVNLIIKKELFKKAGGFDYKYWPGEDTVLCLTITKKLNQNILYHPSVTVYHHRRAAILPHLQQLKRYSIQRGYFVKKFPQTSFRLGYFLPSFFTLYLALLPPLYFLLGDYSLIPLIPLYLYLSILFFTFLDFLLKGNSILASLLALATIPATHIYYGILFIYGLQKKDNNFTPHQVNIDSGEYVGG